MNRWIHGWTEKQMPYCCDSRPRPPAALFFLILTRLPFPHVQDPPVSSCASFFQRWTPSLRPTRPDMAETKNGTSGCLPPTPEIDVVGIPCSNMCFLSLFSWVLQAWWQFLWESWWNQNLQHRQHLSQLSTSRDNNCIVFMIWLNINIVTTYNYIIYVITTL